LSGERLTPFSYVVLAPIGEGGAGPHDLASMMRRGSIHWAAAESQWYGEPKRLERLGLLRSQKAPGKTGPRTHYLLTPKGRDALQRVARRAVVAAEDAERGDRPRACRPPRRRRVTAREPGRNARRLERARSTLEAAHVAAASLPHRRR
jgi:DNA-binding PadR family transcriptional regulator